MKNIIIAILVTLAAFASQATEWKTETHISEMTDEVISHSVGYADDDLVFMLICDFQGVDTMAFAANDYLGISTVGNTEYAVDGEQHTAPVQFKRLFLDGFLTVALFDNDVVAAMTQGDEFRVRQLAPYRNSEVYSISLEGFNKAYMEWGERCSEFY